MMGTNTEPFNVMRFPAFILLFVGLAVPASAPDPSARQSMSIAELEQIVSTTRISDNDLARRLSGIELTHRLNLDNRIRLSAALPGENSRAALAVVADLSQFLDPPAAEIIPTSPPDDAQRVQILNRVAAFVQNAMHNLPNFFATRDTSRFESRSRLHESGKSIEIQETPFRSKDRAVVTVLYRDGAETIEKKSGRLRGSGLTSWGEFGPFLSLITADMLKGTVTFHHWEQSPVGPLAVFDYEVPVDRSSYVVRFCCGLHYDFRRRAYEETFELLPAYHGRIAIEPASGAILRLVVSAELQPENGLSRADVAIEYGPVALGGKSYICPLESVALSVSPIPGQASAMLANPTAAPGTLNSVGLTALNHTVFEDYHLLQVDVKIVPDRKEPAGTQPKQR